jgi:hypothetical protein
MQEITDVPNQRRIQLNDFGWQSDDIRKMLEMIGRLEELIVRSNELLDGFASNNFGPSIRLD